MSNTVIHDDGLVVVTQDAAGNFHWTASPTYVAGNQRTITDGATTVSSPALTSNTANFASPGDVGKVVSGAGIPNGTTILSVQSATSCTLSNNATATAAGVTVVIGANSVTPADQTGAPIYGDDGGNPAATYENPVASAPADAANL